MKIQVFPKSLGVASSVVESAVLSNGFVTISAIVGVSLEIITAKTWVYSSETILREKSCSEEISISLIASFAISEDMERHLYIAKL